MLKAFLWSIGGLIGLCVVAAVGYAAYIEVTTKEPRFVLIRRDGAIEIRAYAPMIVAEVATTGTRRAAAKDGFSALAGYIFGGNRAAAKIAMTAPVIQRPAEGTTIAMTSPVIQQRNRGVGDIWTIRFVMPDQWTLAKLPAPKDPDVTLREVPARRMALIRFSGVVDDALAAAKAAELEAWLVREGLTPTDAPMLAYYNAPWIPGFLRRNEVMIEVADDAQ